MAERRWGNSKNLTKNKKPDIVSGDFLLAQIMVNHGLTINFGVSILVLF
jgi:hypothetical protein